MSTVTKAANAHTVVATGWTNPTNAYSTATDSAFATIDTAKNTTRSGDFGCPAFPTAASPDHSTLTSVVFFTTYGMSATATGALVGEQARRNSTGTTLGSEITRSAATQADANGTATGATLADLRQVNELRVRARGTKGNSSTASQARIDRLYVTATFTETVAAGAGTIAMTPGLTGAGTKAVSQAMGAIAGSASFALSGGKSLSAAAGAIAGAATLEGSGLKAISAAAGTITPTITMEATGSGAEEHSGSGVMVLAALFDLSGQKSTAVSASLSAPASLTVAGRKTGTAAEVSLAAIPALAATGRKDGIGAGSMGIEAALAATAAKAASGTGSLTLAATMAASGGSQATEEHSGAGVMALSAWLVATGAGDLTGALAYATLGPSHRDIYLI